MATRDQLSGPDSLAPGRQSDPWDAFGRDLSRLLRDPTAVGALEFSAPGNGTDGQDRCLLQRAGDESAWVSLRPGSETLIEEMIVWNDRSEPAESSLTPQREQLRMRDAEPIPAGFHHRAGELVRLRPVVPDDHLLDQRLAARPEGDPGRLVPSALQ